MDDYEKYLNLTLRFLSFRGRSEKEVRDYLQKKKAPLEIVDKIIESCREYGFINDEKFAKDWTTSRSNYRLKSKRIIKLELMKKGVDREVIDQTINQAATDGIDDNLQARKLVEKRIGRLRGLTKDEIYRKLVGFLGRRGFDWGTIKTAIDEVLKEEYNK